jgi:hypothetical protein
MQLGDTFVDGGIKYVIKRIDLTGTHPANGTGKPRVDASKFHRTESGEERVKLGRPKKFEPNYVAKLLGEKPVVAEAPPVKSEEITISDDDVEERKQRLMHTMELMEDADRAITSDEVAEVAEVVDDDRDW